MLLNSIIIILTILVCISVGLSILLYKNNKTLEKLISSSFKRDDNVLVQLPKSIENNIDNFISRYQNFENKIQEYLQKNVSSILVSSKETRDLLFQFDEMSKKNLELIERYKEGYDYSRHKSLASKLLLSLDFIKTSKNKIKDTEALEYINSYVKNLENILYEIGIEDYIPNIDTDIKDNIGIEVVDIKTTNIKEQSNKIFIVSEKGYALCSNDSTKSIIKKANVVIYKYEEENKDE